MPEKKSDNQKPKILFYIANYFVFRSGPVGYLYDICQEFPVVFLSEKLDAETEKTLEDKSFFPKLEKIIPIRQFTGEKKNLLQKNFYLYKLAKEVLSRENPDIIICSSDTHSLFELYLMRLAKRKKILKIAVQTANIGDNKIIEKRVDLTNAYLRFPHLMPLSLRMMFVKLRKYLGHTLYYWILPVLVGEMPFFGRASYILYKGNSGMRDADFQTVFSEKDYEVFLQDGVPVKKLSIVLHPLAGKSRKFFEKAFWQKANNDPKDGRIITVLLPEDKIGFRKKDNSFISEDDVFTKRKEIMSLIIEILNDWTIYLKPHPDIMDIEKFLQPFANCKDKIKITDKNDPLDKYIEKSCIILELPLAAGTALFTASLQCPEKPVISVDLNHEILGDYYKNTVGVEYVDSLADLSDLLKKLKHKRVHKKQEVERGIYKKKENKKNEASLPVFSSMADFLNFQLSKR